MKLKYIILSLAALALFLLASCAKPEEEPIETWGDDSTDNFWGKGGYGRDYINAVGHSTTVIAF